MNTFPSSRSVFHIHTDCCENVRAPHQKPLLLWCVVAVPSKAPHYWLMEPHQHRSIKTQHQPHAVVSPGLSEPRLAVTHQGWRLLTSSIQKLMCSGGWRAITYITVNLLFKMLFYACVQFLGLSLCMKDDIQINLPGFPQTIHVAWIIDINFG